jgi:hypothetical protein
MDSRYCPSQMILPDGTLCGHLETVGNPDEVDPLVQQVLCLLQQSPATLISSYCPFKLILPDGTLCGHLETVGNPDGVDPLVQQILGLLQQSPATLISSYCPCKMILPDGTLCGHLKTVGDPDGVDALVQQVLGLLQQSPAQHHHPRSSVSDLIVLKHKKAICSTISASVADPDPIRDHGDEKKNPDPGFAINNPDHIFKSFLTIIRDKNVQNLSFGSGSGAFLIRDPGWKTLCIQR